MNEAWTLGRGLRKRRFVYVGSVAAGVRVLFAKSTMRVSAGFFGVLLGRFAGQSVKGGFSQTQAAPDGFGSWVARHARLLNETRLTPRHASFVAAILVNEGYADSTLEGNAIHLRFRTGQGGDNPVLVPRLLPSENP